MGVWRMRSPRSTFDGAFSPHFSLSPQCGLTAACEVKRPPERRALARAQSGYAAFGLFSLVTMLVVAKWPTGYQLATQEFQALRGPVRRNLSLRVLLHATQPELGARAALTRDAIGNTQTSVVCATRGAFAHRHPKAPSDSFAIR